MTDEEKNDFKISPGLGGPSKTIYQRVLKKIYGNENGAEVIEMLHNNPAHAVPVVLKRLKQKDEEWKRLQRDWNKVWREIDSKNYYKALDYQGVIFKTNDKKNMSIKELVGEIEAIHNDQMIGTVELQEPQLVYQFKNKKVFKDVTRVLYSYFERQTTYGHEDCAVMKAFIEMFLPVFFDVPDVLPEKEQSQDIMLDDEDEDVDDEDAMDEDVDDDDEDNETQHSYDSSTDSRSTKRGANYGRRNGRRSPRHKPNDEDHQKLLKDVLTKKLKSITETKPAEPKIQQLPAEDDDDLTEDSGREQKIYNLFGNTTFYCFFRLFQVCYDRLYQMKQLDKEYRTNGADAKALTKAALKLDISSIEYNSKRYLILLVECLLIFFFFFF